MLHWVIHEQNSFFKMTIVINFFCPLTKKERKREKNVALEELTKNITL